MVRLKFRNSLHPFRNFVKLTYLVKCRLISRNIVLEELEIVSHFDGRTGYLLYMYVHTIKIWNFSWKYFQFSCFTLFKNGRFLGNVLTFIECAAKSKLRLHFISKFWLLKDFKYLLLEELYSVKIGDIALPIACKRQLAGQLC